VWVPKTSSMRCDRRLVWLLPMNDVDRNVEIPAQRHQLATLQRQVDKPRLAPPARAFLAANLHRVPRPTFRHLHLIPGHRPAFATATVR
jgi:hypothetical protein